MTITRYTKHTRGKDRHNTTAERLGSKTMSGMSLKGMVPGPVGKYIATPWGGRTMCRAAAFVRAVTKVFDALTPYQRRRVPGALNATVRERDAAFAERLATCMGNSPDTNAVKLSIAHYMPEFLPKPKKGQKALQEDHPDYDGVMAFAGLKACRTACKILDSTCDGDRSHENQLYFAIVYTPRFFICTEADALKAQKLAEGMSEDDAEELAYKHKRKLYKMAKQTLALKLNQS